MQRDKLLNSIEYIITFMPSVLALILSIHYNLTLETLNTQKGLIVMVLLGIQWLIMFILAIHDTKKRSENIWLMRQFI
jgi:ABC-type transport system involved in cytochrome bd biosynthesis fused ATPase/permease subunit